MKRSTLTIASLLATLAAAQSPRRANWAEIERETLEHFQAVLRLDTRNPMGRETRAAEYLKSVCSTRRASPPNSSRSTRAARTSSPASGERPQAAHPHHGPQRRRHRPHHLVTHPPFPATRDGAYVYGRGAVDDKDNVTAALLRTLLVKRLNVPLDRDIIFLAESGEEGNTLVGIGYVTELLLPKIEAE